MDSVQAITEQLRLYLDRLAGLHQRQLKWLAANCDWQTLNTPVRLQSLTEDGRQLSDELSGLAITRKQLIDQANQLGWAVDSLRSLAQRLPIWRNRGFRASFSAARNRLAQLRRLHTETWVTVHQSAQHCQHLAMLLTQGHTRIDVYSPDGLGSVSPSDSGGQLLDASL
jgi:hypothetical protein